MGVTLFIITNGWEEWSTPANTKWSMFIQSSARSKYKVNDVLMPNEFINNIVLHNYYK